MKVELTNEELYIISNALVQSIQKVQAIKGIAYDVSLEIAIEAYTKRLQSLNRKICEAIEEE